MTNRYRSLPPSLPQQAVARAGDVYQVIVRCGGLHTPRANIAVGGDGRELGLVLHGNLATSRWVRQGGLAVARQEDKCLYVVGQSGRYRACT